MLDTELLGDPAACRETGEWMMRVATGTFDAATVLYEVRSRTHECWRGRRPPRSRSTSAGVDGRLISFPGRSNGPGGR
jgi:hypothetical protein